MDLIKLLLAALIPVGSLAAAPVLTTDFDSMTAGAVDAATLSTATPGGSWSFNTGRGATFEIQNDGTSDQAFLVDDTNGGNSGTLEFFTVTLDSPIDLTTVDAEISFRTAAARSGNTKALRFDLLDSSDTVLAQIQWANNNGVKLNGAMLGDAAFTFHNPWDSVGGVTHDVSISLGGGTTEVTFNTANGTSPFQNSATELAKIRVYSIFNDSSSRGVIMDDLSIDQVLPTDPPVIDSFTMHPDSILGDREVLFTWETTGADSVSIDQGVESVSVDGEDYFAVSAASLPVTFTLTATNSLATPPNDVVTAQVAVTARPGVTEAPALMACWPFDGNTTETVFGATTTLEIGPDGFDDITFVADVPAAIAGRRIQSLFFGTDRNQFGSDDFLTAEFSGVAGSTPPLGLLLGETRHAPAGRRDRHDLLLWHEYLGPGVRLGTDCRRPGPEFLPEIR